MQDKKGYPPKTKMNLKRVRKVVLLWGLPSHINKLQLNIERPELKKGRLTFDFHIHVYICAHASTCMHMCTHTNKYIYYTHMHTLYNIQFFHWLAYNWLWIRLKNLSNMTYSISYILYIVLYYKMHFYYRVKYLYFTFTLLLGYWSFLIDIHIHIFFILRPLVLWNIVI